MNKKLKYGLIGGGVGLFINTLFTFGAGDTLTFNLVDELIFAKFAWLLSYPLTAIYCFVNLGRMCQGEEGMIALFTGPLAGLIIGTLVGFYVYKLKIKYKK